MKSKILVLICTVVLSMTAISASAGKVAVYWFFSTSPNYLYEDDVVKVAVYGMQLVVYNKTDHVIYLDKEMSFAYLNDNPTCLFSNASYTNSTSQGSGSTVNLGAVAGALGVKGSMGSLLSGVNVGSDQTHGSATTVYEQKVVTIAPQSGYIAFEWDTVVHILAKVRFVSGSWSKYIDPKTKKKVKFKQGQTWQFDERTSPVRLRGVINYYPDKDAQEPVQATVNNYISNIVVDNTKGVDEAPLCAPYKTQDYGGYAWFNGKNFP